MSWVGEFQRALGSAPWFLRNKNIGTFLEATRLVLDGAVESLGQGLRLSQPLRGDASALPVLSRDRGIRLYPTEPEESKRYRLSRWWQLRRQFGTHQGEMRNVQPMFLPNKPVMRIVHQSNSPTQPVSTWHTLDADGVYSVHRANPSNWNWDGQGVQWSRFWLIVYTDQLGLAAQPEWDEGQLWDGGSIWDGLLTSAQIADIVAGVKDAKGAHSKLWGVILAPDPTSFDPTASVVTDVAGWSNLPNGKWGYPIDNDTGLPSRLPGAVFAYDLGQG